MTFRGILTLVTGLAFGLAARSGGAAQTAGPPLQPRFDPAGKFAHAADVSIRLLSISPSEVVVECSQSETTAHPAATWRERYLVRDGKIILAAVSTQRDVPAQEEHSEWQETTISESPAAPAIDASHTVSPPGTAGRRSHGGVDPRWSNYGKYLARLIARIQSEWDRARIAGQAASPLRAVAVTITFLLTSRGEAARILNVASSPGLAEESIRACVGAVTAGSPYGDWTDEMTAALGTEQQLTFSFYYPRRSSQSRGRRKSS